jgi:hypothetical protein
LAGLCGLDLIELNRLLCNERGSDGHHSIAGEGTAAVAEGGDRAHVSEEVEQMDDFSHVFVGPAVLEVMNEYTKVSGSSDTSDEYDEM